MNKIESTPNYYKNRLIQIFQDHWGEFKRFHRNLVNEDIKENVEKMMGCGSYDNGYAEYRCSCGHVKIVPFSCKSRFCLRCAKVYIDNWVAKMKQTIFTKVNHRHIILTVPGTLWKYFHNKEMLKLLADCGVELIKEVSKICLKGKKIELGVILVIQTAGRASTWNPHLHLLVTEGGLDKDNKWVEFYYFDYNVLRKKWMYILLNALKKVLGKDREALRLIDEVFLERGEKGLIARAKKEKVRKTDIIGYLIKYVASPPIALSRISGYDGERVQYWYREHPTEKKVEVQVSAYEFIGTLIQHIAPKGLKMVRHYGLYARNKSKKVKEIIDRIFKGVKGATQEFFSFMEKIRPVNYEERIKKSFNIEVFKCPKCGNQLILYKVWHPAYGIVYDIWREKKNGKKVERNEIEKKERPREQQAIEQYSQLCLFPV